LSATKTETVTVAALVPIDHNGVIYRRGQLLDVAADVAASLIERGLAQHPDAHSGTQRHMSAAHATVGVEPHAGPLPLPAGLTVEITMRRSGAYVFHTGRRRRAGRVRTRAGPSLAGAIPLERAAAANTACDEKALAAVLGTGWPVRGSRWHC
jgi:hypothetical protein